MDKRLNSRIKVQKYPIFTEGNDITLSITKVKCTINFQVMSFMVQDKTQIASNTHSYEKIVKKYLYESQTIHASLYIRKWHM